MRFYAVSLYEIVHVFFQEAIVESNKVLYVAPQSVKAILAKANAFYGLGLFEKAMVQHYRGRKINSQFP